MKLIRFGDPGREKPGLQLEDGTRVDASAFGSDYDEAFFGGGGLARLREWPPPTPRARRGWPPARGWVRRSRGRARSSASASTTATTPRRRGRRSRRSRSSSSRRPRRWSGPDDDLVTPRGAEKVDWEVELAVVIGARASYVAEGGRAAAHRRLRAAQRLLRAQLPARARRAVVEGQERGHLRAAGPVPGHARRDPRPAGAAHVAHRERRVAARRARPRT